MRSSLGAPLPQRAGLLNIHGVDGDAGGVEAGQRPAVEVPHASLLDGQDWMLLLPCHLQHDPVPQGRSNDLCCLG